MKAPALAAMPRAVGGTTLAPSPAPAAAPPPEVREAVKGLLLRSEAFRALDPELQRQIARDTADVAGYLALPEGIRANTLPAGPHLARALTDGSPAQASYREAAGEVARIGDDTFAAGAAREGAEVAGLLMQRVNFPTFVASLIEGVFHAIVKANIEQMEAYAKLVRSVAMTLNEFRDHNTTDNQGRDHVVEQFPDLFEIDTGFGEPRLRLREDADEDEALRRVNQGLPMQGGPLRSLDLEDEETERKLTQAARTQVASGRQQLLATMVLMGISRIVVSDGRISAKIMYDFQARDTRRLQRSAVAYDYARENGRLARMHKGEGTYESQTEGGQYTYSKDKDRTDVDYRGANYYAKGEYKYSEQPVMTAMSAASEATDAALQTRAQLAGQVEVNFKSDYLPLEKMVTPDQIAQLQLASRPGGPSSAGGQPASGQTAAGGAPSSTAAPSAQPATTSAG